MDRRILLPLGMGFLSGLVIMMGVNKLKQKAKQRDEAPRKRALSAGDIRPPFPAAGGFDPQTPLPPAPPLSGHDAEIPPPHPGPHPPVVKLLDSASLCYLSTTHAGAPHLSLMVSLLAVIGPSRAVGPRPTNHEPRPTNHEPRPPSPHRAALHVCAA